MGSSLNGTIGIGIDLGWEDDYDEQIVEKYFSYEDSEEEENQPNHVNMIGFLLHKAGVPLDKYTQERGYSEITDLDFESLGFELEMYGFPDYDQVGWALILKDGINRTIDYGIATVTTEDLIMIQSQLPALKEKTDELEALVDKAGCFTEKPEFGLVVTTYYG